MLTQHCWSFILCVALVSQRVNLLNATKTMWTNAPAVVTNVLETLSFDSLASSMPADILYVTAVTPSITFKVAMDKQRLRMLTVDMPGSLSFGDILQGLGATGAESLGDIITVSNTTVVYVTSVNGSGGDSNRQRMCVCVCVAVLLCLLDVCVL